MDTYSVAVSHDSGEEVYELVDRESGSRASVVPGIGAQCLRYVWSHAGEEIDVLAAPESIRALKSAPVHSGNPILFPFPNRIKGGVFEFGGKRVSLSVGDGLGNAIHGLVIDRPWNVSGKGAGEAEGAWVTCTFDSKDFADLSAKWPFPFVIEYTYRLRRGCLESEVRATNAGTEPMPMGFGLHPWFPLPLKGAGSRGACRLKAPVSKVWELERLVPTGEIRAAAPERDLQRGIELGDLEFDDVFAGLNDGLDKGSFSESVYQDPASGIEIAVKADASFRELVVYAPSHRPVVCLEPYTCTTDAFNLSNRGVDSGTIVLAPGESWSGRVIYEPRAIMQGA